MGSRDPGLYVWLRGEVLLTLPRPETYAIKKPKGLGGEYQVAGANRRWRLPFRCRGSRRESAVAQLFSLGGTPLDMLCESCHKAEATCHVCTIVDGISQSRDLCSECHEASSPEARDLSAAQREARCEYCGGQPCAGGTDNFAMMAGEQKFKFMCMLCSMEQSKPIHSAAVAARCSLQAFAA